MTCTDHSVAHKYLHNMSTGWAVVTVHSSITQTRYMTCAEPIVNPQANSAAYATGTTHLHMGEQIPKRSISREFISCFNFIDLFSDAEIDDPMRILNSIFTCLAHFTFSTGCGRKVLRNVQVWAILLSTSLFCFA